MHRRGRTLKGRQLVGSRRRRNPTAAVERASRHLLCRARLPRTVLRRPLVRAGRVGDGRAESITLAVRPSDLRRLRRSSIAHVLLSVAANMLAGKWDNPTGEELPLFGLGCRLGGEKYSCDHAFYGYYDRFWQKNPKYPNVFVASHPDWFGRDYSPETLKRFHGQPPQMCYLNPGFIDQVVEDARAFFDGRGATAEPRDGRLFRLGAHGQSRLVPVPACRPSSIRSGKRTPNMGWTFQQRVCQQLLVHVCQQGGPRGRQNASRQVSGHDRLCRLRLLSRQGPLEPNVSVQMCLHVRNWWAPGMKENDMRVLSRLGAARQRPAAVPVELLLFPRFARSAAAGIVFPASRSYFGPADQDVRPRRNSWNVYRQPQRSGRLLCDFQVA